ncbi:MAG: hypothetical protein Kow0069_38010 [Promethearchaeota archaeon]
MGYVPHMIDDEDEYAEYFRKDRLKSAWNVLKAVAFLALMVLAYLLVQVGLGGGGSAWTMAGFLLLCLGSTLLSVKRTKPKSKPHAVTVVRCTNCGHVVVRDHVEGDYVYKEDEPCSKCTADTIIDQIFAVRLKPAAGRESAGDSEFEPKPVP